MADPWLTIIGLGEDGHAGLSDASREALAAADIIFGGPRHLALVDAGARGCEWSIPFEIDPVLAQKGRKVVVLASGNPFWYGVGGSLSARLSPEDWTVHPAPSTFSLAAARLGWRIEETACLGLHAAPFERLVPIVSQGVRVICLMRNGAAVTSLADWLTDRGFGPSEMTVMEALGGPSERIRTARADEFTMVDIEHPVAVGIAVAGNKGLPRASGLSDDVFAHDGQITKRPIRAMTVSALAPRSGERLWDLGAGSGSISVEWCLAASGATAVAVETRADRAANIRTNAAAFGLAHRLSVIEASVPDGLEAMPVPDAVFVGGGVSSHLLERVWEVIPAGTRLVANAVTLESEALLVSWQADKGGDLLRMELSSSAPLGRMRGWDRARPVVQWSVLR